MRSRFPLLLATQALFTHLLAGPAAGISLQLEPLPAQDAPAWDASQFVAADRAGNVFFLRADTLDVHPLTRRDVWESPVRLKTAASAGGEVHDAALSPDGDSWLIRTARAVRLFESGKEKIVPPLSHKPFAAGFLRDAPLVALAPLPQSPVRDSKKVGAVPWLQRLDTDRWSTLLEHEGIVFAELVKKDNWVGEALENEPLSLTTDRQGRLWAARRYAYRVQRFSSAGRLLMEITVDKGKVRKKKESKGVEVEWSKSGKNPTRNPTEATHSPGQEKATFYPFTAEEVIQDLTEGRDGRMYFLVALEDGGAALDRYDPVEVKLERAALSLKGKGWFSLASGRDALYLAAKEGRGGRWRISWEALEQAAWKEVENVAIDGFPAENETEKAKP
jgi:hypothetical protein